MKRQQDPKIDPQGIVDQLYDIAIDPESLDGFIGAWNDAGLDAHDARQTIEKIDQFDAAYKNHLARAETFLRRAKTDRTTPDFAGLLAPFDSLAAFVVDTNRVIVAANAGARTAFGMDSGTGLDALELPDQTHGALDDSLRSVFASADQSDRLLRVDLQGARGPTLFQIHKLAHQAGSEGTYALIVTTQYHWKAALGQTLEEVFNLTSAEQGVVRALVEGQDTKAIAATRGTSEGTVRGQIKSILAKMNARTQSEVIRLVMSLREISQGAQVAANTSRDRPQLTSADWLHAEVWKSFKSVTLPDGRRMDYHDMGPVTGAPILYTHMGYCMVRWHRPMIKLAFQLGLRIIVPLRAGYGQSDNIDFKADVKASTRADTVFLLDHLGIDRLPYVPQGNDLIFAVDLASHHPDRVSEIIGICARPNLLGDKHYASMSKWHRFFLSTAQHAPHLLRFTVKAATSMCKRIGVTEMYKHMNGSSASDMLLLEDADVHAILAANAELAAGKDTDVSQAYTMEIIATEAPWSDLMVRAKGTPTRFINGADDPSYDIATIAEYREAYPWIEIEVVQNAGQMLIYKAYESVIPTLAEAAKRAQSR